MDERKSFADSEVDKLIRRIAITIGEPVPDNLSISRIGFTSDDSGIRYKISDKARLNTDDDYSFANANAEPFANYGNSNDIITIWYHIFHYI